VTKHNIYTGFKQYLAHRRAHEKDVFLATDEARYECLFHDQLELEKEKRTYDKPLPVTPQQQPLTPEDWTRRLEQNVERLKLMTAETIAKYVKDRGPAPWYEEEEDE
jgi:hypothetical protein